MEKSAIDIDNNILTIILRFFFHLLYFQFSWAYDTFANLVSVGYWNKWIVSILPYVERKRILELGFGTGILQQAMSDSRIFCFGIDKSRQMCSLAKKRLINNGFIQRIANASAESLPFPRNSFDQVVTTFPSEFIVKTTTLNEIWRVLAPGGQLIIVPYAWISGKKLYERFAAWLFRITKQVPDNEVKEYTSSTGLLGFNFYVKHLDVKNSTLQIILATKPE